MITDEQLAADDEAMSGVCEGRQRASIQPNHFISYIAEVRRLRELLRRAEKFVYCCYSHPKQESMEPVAQMLDDITEALGP